MLHFFYDEKKVKTFLTSELQHMLDVRARRCWSLVLCVDLVLWWVEILQYSRTSKWSWWQAPNKNTFDVSSRAEQCVSEQKGVQHLICHQSAQGGHFVLPQHTILYLWKWSFTVHIMFRDVSLNTCSHSENTHRPLFSCHIQQHTSHLIRFVCTSGLMLGYLSEYLPVTSVYTACVCTWSGSSVNRRRTSRPLFPRPLVSLWSLCCCLGLWLHLRSGLKESTTHFCKKREKESRFSAVGMI